MRNVKDISNYFADCNFVEESHKYYVNGKELHTSVSGVIKTWTPKVDFDSIAAYKDTKLGLPEGSHKAMWNYKAEAAMAKGTQVHFFGEMYYYSKELVPCNGYEEAVVKFYKELPSHIEVVGVEVVMYHKDYMFGGMADLLLYNHKTGEYIIGDYKTNENLHKRFKDNTLLGEFTDLPDSPLGKYKIQLSTYSLMAEQAGINVKCGLVVWLKPDGTYELITCEKLPQLSEALKNLYNG